MTVNVSLCGSIPRSEMMSCASRRPRLDLKQTGLQASQFATNKNSNCVVTMAASSLMSRKVSDDNIVSSSQVIEPPSWAVPARGEAFLEPVSETTQLHQPVNLASQAVYRIGRSEISDLQLLHSASSRRHAILFHHPNGSCYLVDCGSAHGTFLNGKRVKSSITANGVIPQRVKKGALLRFGGPGAPSFILKSFSVGIESLIQNVDGIKAASRLPKANIVEDETMTSTLETKSAFSLDAVVALNTRLNSVSNISTLFPDNDITSLAAVGLRAHRNFTSRPNLLKKRSFVSFDEDNDERDHKRLKLSSSAESTDSNDSIGIPFVSPTRQKPLLDFDYSLLNRPVVSPNPFDGSEPILKLGHDLQKGVLTGSLTLDLSSSSKKRRKSVNFSADTQVFYPPTVTPESTSDSEEK